MGHTGFMEIISSCGGCGSVFEDRVIFFSCIDLYGLDLYNF